MTDAPADASVELLSALGDHVLELTPAGDCVRLAGDRGAAGFPAIEVGQNLRDVLPPRVAASTLEAVAAVLRGHGPRVFEYELPSPEGPRYQEARLATAPLGNVFAVVRDVHARRVAEERLRESEARFRLMADAAPVMLWKAGTDGECDFFNARWLEFTGRAIAEELGSRWAEGVHPEDFARCMDTYLAAFVERREFRMEYRLRRGDGTFRWILDHGVPRFSPAGVFEGYVGSCIDITELREAGDEIRGLYGAIEDRLREREALLREVHHRVKNNLQLISSLIGLNARRLDGASRQLMEEGQTRVRSIALIHEKLYESRNLAHVDLTEYARDLVRVVLHAVGARDGIRVRVGGDTVRLAVDQASPCGLVINELLTNALKHAFPGGRSGSVEIDVRQRPAGKVAVTVRDDGVGLPAGVDLVRPATVGLDVVVTLAEQLEAELEVLRSPGATFRLTFPTRGDAP